MTLALGTNSGFVTVAPTTDPADASVTIDGSSIVTKHTSPANATLITEVGWYRVAGTDNANWEIGLYSEAAGVADVLLFSDVTNSNSTTGWLTATVSWPITPSTAYWLGVQMDAHTGSSSISSKATGGAGRDIQTSQTALTNPYGGGAVNSAVAMFGVYAVVVSSVAAGHATTTIGGAF
jgi:hypothetical protein